MKPEEPSRSERIIDFLEQYDLGWNEEVWTIAKKTLEDLK